MNGTKEPVRKMWSSIENAARRNKRTALIGVGSLALMIAVLTHYGITAKEEHAGEHEHEQTRGETAVVHLSEEAQKASGVEVATVALEAFSTPIEATAAIELDGNRVAKIGARTTGRLVKIAASQGDAVRTGQALAWFDSPELGQAWAEYAKAKGRAELARRNLQREETLFAKKISPEKDVIRARQELAETEADLGFAGEKLHLLGIDAEQFGKPGGNQHPLIAVTSPISGSVIERAATQGEVVSPEKTLFTVADLSRLWVIIDIYEKDLGRIKPGTPVKVSTTAYAEKGFRGVISYLGEVMDEKTRTIKARVEIENAGRLLKPGMFAVVTIDTKVPHTEEAITIPEEAVFLDGSRNYVFIQTAQGKFEMREVAVGRTMGTRLEVLRGLTKGEPIAVKGAFILKSELKKAELAD